MDYGEIFDIAHVWVGKNVVISMFFNKFDWKSRTTEPDERSFQWKNPDDDTFLRSHSGAKCAVFFTHPVDKVGIPVLSFCVQPAQPVPLTLLDSW